MASPTNTGWTDIGFTNRDGLQLHARRYGDGGVGRRPLVCLPGLTRNGRDFHDLAMLLSDPRGHRRAVYTLDSRGRGLSEHDKAREYTVAAETADALDFFSRCDLDDAAVLGTSRGGILAMAIAAQRPGAVGAVILNDVGPVIERNGLARILAYVGRTPLPRSWPEAAQMIKEMNREHFPKLDITEAEAVARQQFNERDGRPAPGYDPAIAGALTLPDGPQPAMWKLFGALSRVPVLVLRGGNSDLLSAATVTEMQRRHTGLVAHTVPDEGHAPLLRDQPTQELIRDFLMRTDTAPAGT